MRIFVWDRFDDGSYGGDASAAVIAETPDDARALVLAEWRTYCVARGLDPDAEHGDTSDGGAFYGVGCAGFYAPGIVRGLQTAGPPDRVIEIPEQVVKNLAPTIAPQIVLLHKGYEG